MPIRRLTSNDTTKGCQSVIYKKLYKIKRKSSHRLRNALLIISGLALLILGIFIWPAFLLTIVSIGAMVGVTAIWVLAIKNAFKTGKAIDWLMVAAYSILLLIVGYFGLFFIAGAKNNFQ